MTFEAEDFTAEPVPTTTPRHRRPEAEDLAQEAVRVLLDHNSDPIQCGWFALCRKPATGYTKHPVLGSVPTCTRCHYFATDECRVSVRSAALRATDNLPTQNRGW